MNQQTIRGFQVLWLIAFLAAGAYFWTQGSTTLSIGLVVVGLVWEIIGFVVAFKQSFTESFNEAQQQQQD